MLVRLIGLFLLCWLASFLLVRTMLTSRTDRSQVEQMAGILANNIALTELALEHYPPPAVSQLNGFQLLVTNRPSLSGSDDRRLGAQLERLSQDLCDRLGHCPTLVPHPGKVRGVWIRIRSSLEPVWLFSAGPGSVQPRSLGHHPVDARRKRAGRGAVPVAGGAASAQAPQRRHRPGGHLRG
jgi:hypothetical protein